MKSAILYSVEANAPIPEGVAYTRIPVSGLPAGVIGEILVRAEIFDGDMDAALDAASPLPGEVVLNTVVA